MGVGTRRLLRSSKYSSSIFSTEGGTIYAPDGSVFVPIGANIGLEGYAATSTTTALGHAADAKAWGWNCVRFPVLATTYRTYSYPSVYGYSAFLTMLDQAVTQYTAQGIVVMIDCHDLWMFADGNLGVNCSRIGELDTFWTDMATRYKNNPYVWFNLHNEPPVGGDAWADLHVRHTELIRTAGARNIIVCDGPLGALDNAGQPGVTGKSSWDSTMLPRVLTAADGNVVLAMHNYGAYRYPLQYDTYISNVTTLGNVPLVIGEYGYTIDGSTTSGTYNANYISAQVVLNKHPTVGMIWWNANHTDKFSLKSDGTPFYQGGASANLSPAGQRLWDIGHGVNNRTTLTFNWFHNPVSKYNASISGGWSASAGYTAAYRTGQSGWANSTTTDVACDTGGWLIYYKSDLYEWMPAGSYTLSFQILMPVAASVQFQIQWFDKTNAQVGSSTWQTTPCAVGVNSITMPFTKPSGTLHMRMTVDPLSVAAGNTFAVTNFTTASEWFTGDTPASGGTKYFWAKENDVSASVRIV